MKNAKNSPTDQNPEERAKVRFITVLDDQQGRRLDNFLLSVAPGVPKSRIYRAIRSGEVRINKGRTNAKYRVKEGDLVRVPPLHTSARVIPKASDKGQRAIVESIIERHKGYYVLNKPSGWAVHGGSGISLGVIEMLRQALPDEHYLELVHRLDRATSGCLLIARRRPFLREMHRQIRDNEVGKTYLLLVKGHWDFGRYRCEVNLQTHHRQNGERHVQADANGKYCRTDFRPVEFYRGATLLEAQLITGRTHQIRVHCAHLGHPIAGDERYGSQEFNKLIKKQGGHRLFLHSSSIAFEYPEGNPCQFGAPLGDEFVALLNKLGTTSNNSKRGNS